MCFCCCDGGRRSQWFRQLGTCDRWPEFCRAAQTHTGRRNCDLSQVSCDSAAADAPPLDDSVDAGGLLGPDQKELAAEHLLCSTVSFVTSSCSGCSGDADVGVPPEAHQAMEAMALREQIPKTSLAQRQRNRPTSGSSYGVPAELVKARDFGYIHPNLPPPAGFIWRSDAGSFRLMPRGG